MDASDFIVPPPGIVPETPKAPAETVRAARPVERSLPAFAPGRTGPGTPPMRPPATPPAQPPAVQPAAAQPPAVQPAATGLPSEAEVTCERVTWRLAGAGGVDVVVTARSVVGRAPIASGAEAGAMAVAVDDPARTVSKTHAVLEPAGQSLAVTDLHSTNGVRIERQDGSVEVLPAGGTAWVADGEVLVLGELRLLVARMPSPSV